MAMNGRPRETPMSLKAQLVLKRMLPVLQSCPAGCVNATSIIAAPPPHQIDADIDGKLVAWARCMRCLTYWEVTQKGEVQGVRWGVDVPKDEKGNPVVKPG